MSKIKIDELANGLKVYFYNISGKKTISCGIWINQGSKDEERDNCGLSHLVEHLMFRIKSAESNISMSSIMERIINKGAFYNAKTSKDNTAFYIEGLREDFQIILETLSYLVVNKQGVSQVILNKEKEVVLREAEEYLMSSAQMTDRVAQAMWGNDSFGNMTIGSYESINKITCEMVDNMIKKSYTPDNSVLVLVGDLKDLDIKRHVNKYFSVWKGKHLNQRTYTVRSKSKLIVDNSFNGTRSTVGIGLKAYPYIDKRFQYVEILKNVLVNPNSRLINKLRNEKGWVYSLRGFSNSYSCVGNVGIVFSANNEFIEEIVKYCMAEFSYLVEKGIDEGEFERLKSRRILEVLFALESSLEYLKSIGEAVMNGQVFSVDEYISDIRKLNISSMNEVINEILGSRDIATAILGKVDMSKINMYLDINNKELT